MEQNRTVLGKLVYNVEKNKTGLSTFYHIQKSNKDMIMTGKNHRVNRRNNRRIYL